MALSILNNIPSLAAQNQLSITGAGLQKTLYRLSSGSRINSGADDAAGLAIADGLRANVSALTQSARNATDGVGKLQVADGALAQVTNLLNRAVTLATEAGTGTVSDTQRKALNTEFVSIKAELVRIGQKTSFNGDSIFNSAAAPTDKNTLVASAKAATSATALTTAHKLVLTDSDTGDSFTFTTNGTLTTDDLVNQINSSTTVNATASLDNNGFLQIVDKNGNGSLLVASNTVNELGAVAAKVQTDPNKFVATTATAAGLALTTAHAITITDTDSGKSFSFASDGVKTVQNLIDAINADTNVSAAASLDSNGKLQIVDKNGNGSLSVVSDLTDTGTIARAAQSGSAVTDIFLSDGTSAGAGSISVTIGVLSDIRIGFGSNSVDISSNDLLTKDNATAALTKITSAISNVAADRGTLGAAINRLGAASNVISNQIQNLSAAEDGIRAADIAQEVANMTKFTILNQTGISALAQSNQMQQSVLSLLR
jgi:flagellin